MADQRLPIVNADDGAWGDILNEYLGKEHYNGDGNFAPATSTNGSHQRITIRPGTASSNTAPLKFTSGALLTAAEAGAIEFNSDTLYFTQTTTATRKIVATYPNTGGAPGDVYYRGSGGNLVVLPIGTDTYVLTLTSGVPMWAAPPGSGSGLTHPQVMARISMGF